MIRKLRVKFVCIIMAIVTVMLCVIFGTVYHFTRKNLENESLDMMQEIVEASGPFGMPVSHRDLVRLPYFTLQINAWGEVLAVGGDTFDLSDEAFLREIMEAAISSEEPTGVLEQYDLRFCRVRKPGGLQLVYADISMERSILENLIWNSVLIACGSLLVFLALSILFARWAVKPVEHAWQQQRRFVADASHELKTPLTVILTNAELLQSEESAPEEQRKLVAGILTMSRQMRGLVERLLELARVENGAVHPVLNQVDLGGIVTDAALTFEALLFEQSLTLELEIGERIQLRGSESHLRQLVEIFLDNAMKYSEKPGQVTVRLFRQGSSVVLSVSNPGPTIPPEVQKRLFERFYRADQVRTVSGSYGLGLSIADAIVRAHRGKIRVDSENGTNTFTVLMPMN